MNDFMFHNPTKVHFGKNKIELIGKELKTHGIKKVLLHFGKVSIFKNGVYDRTKKSLVENNIEFVELGEVKANPILSKVYEGIDIIKENKIEGVLAVGGGSVIDSAKAIAAGALYDGDVWDLFSGKSFSNKSLPIFTILTLSATGSEMNSFAVITKEDEFKKWAFSTGEQSYPKVSIIEPEIQFSLPQNQTANGAIDAIAHVMELYFDGTNETGIQDEIAEGLIRNIIKHSKILMNEPNNYNSRAELAWSATLALNGVNAAGRSGGDWATHTLEHSLSAYYDIAHGAGLAIMFPAWIKYVYNEKPDRFFKLARNVFGIENESIDITITELAKALQNYFSEMKAPISLGDINVKESDVEKLVENASIILPQGRLKKLMRDDIREIYKLAL